MEALHNDPKSPPYASRLMSGRISAAIFRSEVTPASELLAGAPADLNVYTLDDVVFSLKARRLGFKIHAAIDVPTVHDGMVGCFSEELERLDRAREAAAAAKKPALALVGPDGRPVK